MPVETGLLRLVPPARPFCMLASGAVRISFPKLGSCTTGLTDPKAHGAPFGAHTVVHKDRNQYEIHIRSATYSLHGVLYRITSHLFFRLI